MLAGLHPEVRDATASVVDIIEEVAAEAVPPRAEALNLHKDAVCLAKGLGVNSMGRPAGGRTEIGFGCMQALRWRCPETALILRESQTGTVVAMHLYNTGTALTGAVLTLNWCLT